MGYLPPLRLHLGICQMWRTIRLTALGHRELTEESLCKTLSTMHAMQLALGKCLPWLRKGVNSHKEMSMCLNFYTSSIHSRDPAQPGFRGADLPSQDEKSNISKLSSALHQCGGPPNSGILLMTFWQSVWCSALSLAIRYYFSCEMRSGPLEGHGYEWGTAW